MIKINKEKKIEIDSKVLGTILKKIVLLIEENTAKKDKNAQAFLILLNLVDTFIRSLSNEEETRKILYDKFCKYLKEFIFDNGVTIQ